MRYFLTEVSTNRKTGPIPVSTSSQETCPSSCPLLGKGCYAENGPLRIHWQEISSGTKGMDFDSFVKSVSKIMRNQLWRYGQAGDLPGVGDEIDEEKLTRLAVANRNRPVIAFTHKPPTEKNLQALRKAKDLGFPVNLSADNLDEAVELKQTGLPVAVVIHSDYARKSKGGGVQ